MSPKKPHRYGWALPLFVAALFSQSEPGHAAAKIERVISPGGIEAWLVTDPSVPVIAADFLFIGGSTLDPEGQEGLAALTASLLNEGAGELDSQAFLKRLADLSISLNFKQSLDTFSGSLKTLSENSQEAFRLLGLALREPRFDPEAIARMRAELIGDLQRAQRNPRHIARRAWWETAFKDHPYARPGEGTKQGLEAITQQALKQFARERLTKDRLMIGVCGDITPEELAPYLDLAFGDLPRGSALQEPDETTINAKGRLVIETNIPQSVVLFGQDAPKRNDPDYFAARLVNYILGGGGFASRLTNEVREKRGLVYSIHSYLTPQRQAGLITGGLASGNDSVAEALKILHDEWERMGQEGVLADELHDAKTYMTGAFPLNLTTTTSIASLLTAMQYHELGLDYLERRNTLINAVTLEQANRVAKTMLNPETLLTIIVGNPPSITSTLPN